MFGPTVATPEPPLAPIPASLRLPRRGLAPVRAFTLLCASVAPVIAAASDESAGQGWSLLANYRFRDAATWFTSATDPNDRAAALGHAAAQLNAPPVTPGGVAAADAALQTLVARDDPDAITPVARYLQARVAHLHHRRGPTDVEPAYTAVIDAGAATNHPLAQLAAGKLALVYLYERPDWPLDQRLAAAAALESVAARPALPEIAIAYHRALAGASLYFGRTDRFVLHHLRRALALEPSDPLLRATLHVQAGEVARALGDAPAATGHYREFLSIAAPTDMRRQTVLDRLAALSGPPEAAP